MADKSGTTIIIKKIKKGGHGHHGGAWKVAYADFVTAMMSFFLLLWLLTATPVENLEGVADYFAPTIGVQGKMGIGFSGGRSPTTEGWSHGDWASMGFIFGAPPSGPIIKFPDKDNKINEDNDRVNFNKMRDDVTKDIQENPEFKEYQDSILIEQAPDGLRINIMDTEDRPMFKPGTAELEQHAKKILTKVATVVKDIPNYLEIAGNTSYQEMKDGDYTGWELSADRANSARRYLLKSGVEPTQIARVLALSDQNLLDVDKPESKRNNRVTVTLLRKTALSYHQQAAPDDIILGPVEEGLKEHLVNQKNQEEEEARQKKLLEAEKKKSGGGHGGGEGEAETPEGAAPAVPEVRHFIEGQVGGDEEKKGH